MYTLSLRYTLSSVGPVKTSAIQYNHDLSNTSSIFSTLFKNIFLIKSQKTGAKLKHGRTR